MGVEPARHVITVLCEFMDSLRLPGNLSNPPHDTQLPVIEHVTNLNNFRIIKFH